MALGSPDMNPLDYFFLGLFEKFDVCNKTYELRNRILDAAASIISENLQNVLHNFYERLSNR